LVRDHVRPTEQASILDLGCGTGELLDYLPVTVKYLGIDISSAYIARARERFGTRATFEIGDVTEINGNLGGFDLVLAFGLVHHLDDSQADRLFHFAGGALNPRGRVITVDTAVTADQSGAARAMVRRDRGRHVRTPADYSALAAGSFANVLTTVRGDLLRVPYTHCILECDGPAPQT
jgi:cyclopropane fatty-acyl-phospholipid synthase-like methyltransferase